MAKLSSFVFFDLETTDIPGLKTPKITELSLIACSKLHLLQTKHGKIPRVLHKQTFCLNPQRLIHPKASEVTGLYNDLLENESKFDENTGNILYFFSGVAM
uniref:Three prime repair exonuclease 2 n=1 Tax=Culex pipiens TaxID=7175 RepID=A0A8D8CGN0_CULPI